MLHVMLWEGWIDAAYIAAHTERLRRAARRTVRDCTPEHVAQVCGIAEDDLLQAARWFADLGGHAVAVLPGPEPVVAAAPPRTRR